ncbi:MAG: 30S ribosomal protein S16 [Omnitrophica bacterium RIFCSPHIGHO2_02_FULL_49_9]|nr:MAG: 30S ribosomal protein S16 [Omnitrophica bacterium RIFCSPHIGHO2_02_FULL_49_9]OGW88832.1 MAG: 30S ribosomal protein S16 [Omnitrophica bacterium RIFCSPLOWO2_01_FULL_50_24]
MAVRIRLKRFGTKSKAHWRVVVCDARSPRDGRFIEHVGYYDPRTNPARIQLKLDRIQDWIAKGAQPTATVKSLVRQTKRTSR